MQMQQYYMLVTHKDGFKQTAAVVCSERVTHTHHNSEIDTDGADCNCQTWDCVIDQHEKHRSDRGRTV